MIPYQALWRTDIPGCGIEYRAVTVVSAPLWGHVKCNSALGNNWALPVDEIVGIDADGYAVITPGGKPCLARRAAITSHGR